MDNTMKTEKLSNIKIGFGTKVSYGLGSFSINVIWSLAANYLLIFYTDVFGIAGTVAAVILLVARVWDCFVDPIVGLVMERTNTKHGRFRPYILYGTIFLGIFNILTFYTPTFGGIIKIVYATVVYLVLGSLYSVVNIPFNVLPSAMTTDLKDRSDLYSFSGFFSGFSGIVTGAAVMPLILMLGHGNSQRGYFLTAIVLTIISLPLLFITFANCKEVVIPSKEEKPSIAASLKAVLANKNVLLVYVSLFLMFCAGAGKAGVVTYYCIYVLNNPALIATVFTGFSAASVFTSLLPQIVLRYLDKKIALAMGLIVMCLSNIIIYFTPNTNFMIVIIFSICALCPIGYNIVIVNSMMSDCVDENHLKTGTRSDGAIFSFMSLVTKIGNALVGSASLLILSALGYVANAKQTTEAINGINTVTNLLPAILAFVALIPVFFYTISREKANETSRLLAEKETKNTTI